MDGGKGGVWPWYVAERNGLENFDCRIPNGVDATHGHGRHVHCTVLHGVARDGAEGSLHWRSVSVFLKPQICALGLLRWLRDN